MVAIWLPFGSESATGFGARRYGNRLRILRNASECPCSLANHGRDTFSIRVVLEARKHPGFIGTRARSVVAPRGHASSASVARLLAPRSLCQAPRPGRRPLAA